MCGGGDMSFDYSYLRRFKSSAIAFDDDRSICDAIEAFQIVGKRIEKILLLGTEDKGGRLVYSHDAQFVCFLLEPVVIVFEDGTTLGIQIITNDTFRLGLNILPQTITRGINQNSLDGEATFSFLRGVSITGVDFHRKKSVKSRLDDITLELILEKGLYKISISNDLQGWTKISFLMSKNPRIIPGNFFKEVRTTIPEVFISDGYLITNTFTFFPCLASENKEFNNTIDGCCFGIEEDYFAEELLSFFLSKHFEKKLNDDHNSFSGEGYFDDYYYSKASIQLMIKEMKEFASELKKDKQLIRKVFSLKEDVEEIFEAEEMGPKESIILVLIDFIERFCEIMHAVIEDYDVQYFMIQRTSR